MFLPSFLEPYNHLALHAALSASVALLSSALALPSRPFEGLHTYIHPENVGNGGVRASIRRPESSVAASTPAGELKRRTRSKEKFEFDEANAQLFRLRLVDSHLRTRLYFPEYRAAFISSFAALSSLIFRWILSEDSDPESACPTIPVLSSLFAISCLVFSLAKLSFERSATKRSEKQLSVLLGFLGFLVALIVVFPLSPSIFDFEFDGPDAGLAKVTTAALAGTLTGLMFVPAFRAARSLWLGTDQLRWKLSVISCGTITRVLLYASFLSNVFVVLLWINPMADVPARIIVDSTNFREFRVWCLIVSAALQLMVLRPSLQMYLNEAVLSWYQRLHASKVPDLDYGRAKIFLHNYYLCLVILQFFVPPALVLMFIGLSQTRGNLFSGILFMGNLAACSSMVKGMALFMAWWILFVWVIFSTSTLALFRCGFLFIS